ncbi:uncharacterized protein LOC131653015 isoform X2 [Vicia villosa]|uniref:uncharacterized protein LOC131653015 isoform X2 n=1 Tax=Vicia villosa TaxID=3911 RepID=UPI00273B1289|nr:uncharacterized protein LOC131653015 isoform X2 [Vicia villosa]
MKKQSSSYSKEPFQQILQIKNISLNQLLDCQSPPRNTASCSISSQLQPCRDEVRMMHQWGKFQQGDKFKNHKLYDEFVQHYPKSDWSALICKNKARPRAVFMLWLACQHRLATKDRLAKIGVNTDLKCVFYNCSETSQHLFLSAGL